MTAFSCLCVFSEKLRVLIVQIALWYLRPVEKCTCVLDHEWFQFQHVYDIIAHRRKRAQSHLWFVI